LATVVYDDYFKIATGLALQAVETLAQPFIGGQRRNHNGDNGGAQVLILAR